MENNYQLTSDIIEIAEKEGLFIIRENKIKYVKINKNYKITDPEEYIRASFYFELIKKYQYPIENIDLEVIVPRRKPEDQADIVIYEDPDMKKPYIVVECKKDGISPAEIQQADEQAIGNANSLRAKYSILIAGNVKIARDIAGYPQREREKNKIADIPIRFGKVVKYVYKKGGPKEEIDPSRELKEVNRVELLYKFQQCHDTLWEGGKRNPAEAFDEMSKLMYCKIQDERFLTKKGEFYRFQVGTHETIDEVGDRIKKIYKNAQKIDKEVFIEPIKTDNSIIYTIAEILQGISLAKTDLDVKGEGYEYFLGGVFRGSMGQYFTPRPIVSFMVEVLEPTIDDFIIDPACGSGGFLIYTLEKMRKELYSKLDERDAAYRWQDFALKQIFGIEINNQLARVSMMNMIIHEDGHTNVENADALDYPINWNKQKIKEFYGKEFSILLTNPPFGAVIKEKEKLYLNKYELGGKIIKRKRQNTEILFIERCINFIKPGGQIGIILPDGILTNESLQYVRDYILDKTQLISVISLPQIAFRKPSSKGGGDSGSGIKASILFLKKKKDKEKILSNYPIFMSIVEHVGYDTTGRPDKNEFPNVLQAWHTFKENYKKEIISKNPLCFVTSRDEINDALNPLRFTMKIPKGEKWLKIKDIGIIINQTYNPAKNAPQQEFDWIRIDDLENDPITINSIRRIIGKDIKGPIQMLQEGDILIARLGPSIANKKFVIVLPTEKQTIGSTEFIVLRLNKNIDPYFALGIFKTDFYMHLMLSQGRGGTPSRYRLSRIDFSLFPFPKIDFNIQKEIGLQVRNQYEKVIKLRENIKTTLFNTNKTIEDIIL